MIKIKGNDIKNNSNQKKKVDIKNEILKITINKLYFVYPIN